MVQQALGWWLGGVPSLGVAPERYVVFSQSVGYAQLQTAQFSSGWQVDSWHVSPGSPMWRAWGTGLWKGKSENPT